MNLLVVKTSSMGDVVHTLPAVSDIAAHFPDVQIDWLVEKPFAAICALHPAVRQVIPMQLRKWRKSPFSAASREGFGVTLHALRATPYDWIIDFQGLVKSAWFCRLAGKRRSDGTRPIVAGYDWSSLNHEPYVSWAYQRRASVPRDAQAVARNRLLAAAHLGYAVQGPPQFCIAAPTSECFDWLGQGDYAVLMPAASRPEKLWPQNDWIALMQTLRSRGLRIVVLWGSAQEQAMAQALADAGHGIVPPFLTVAEAAQVLAQAKIVVGLDTGFTHLAAALGVPAIGIYCDHEPGLAGLTGAAFTASLGGTGQPPTRAAVLAAIEQALHGS